MTRHRRRGPLATTGQEDTDESDGETADESDGQPEDDDLDNTVEDLRSEADPLDFDRTFQAPKENFQLSSEVPAPTPFPLQAIPRLAYTVNYQMVYDEDNEVWEPQKKDSLAGAALVDSITGTISNSQTLNDPLDPDVEVGDVLLPVLSVDNRAGGASDIEVSQGRIPDEPDHIVHALVYNQDGSVNSLVVAGSNVGTVEFTHRIYRVGEF